MNLVFLSRDENFSLVYSQHEAGILVNIMLSLAKQKGWDLIPYAELNKLVRVSDPVSHLNYDAANARQYYSLVVSMLEVITASTDNAISMVHRWERKHPNEPIQDLPPLIQSSETEFKDVATLSKFLGFLALVCSTGQGFAAQPMPPLERRP